MKETWSRFTEGVRNWFTDAEMWETISITTFKIILIIVVAQLLLKILNTAVGKMIVERETSPLRMNPRRSKTFGKLVNNIVTYVVNFIMVLMILYQMGIQVGPLLAGAGVVGIAIGFGAQSLVRDIITGFFIIFEDQFAVGDVVQTGTFRGTVEEIGLRVTKIKSPTGEVHIIPNGSILNATNFSIYDSVFTVDIPLDHSCDIDKALEVIQRTLTDSNLNIEHLEKPAELLGVQNITNMEMVVRISAQTKHHHQFQVMRALNAAIKKSLDEHEILLASGARR